MAKQRTVVLLGLAAAICAAVVPARAARASAELDRKYALETVGALRSWDNVDGLFADYVAAAYRDYFSRQTRFRMQDLSKADELLIHSKLPYSKAIEDPEILGQLSRSLKAQSLLRTRIFKEGPRYRFTIDWLHSPGMDVLATETFNLEDAGVAGGGAVSDGSGAREFAGLGDIKGKLQAALDRMFAKVPFVGQVTGRDNGDVTVNLGAVTGLKRGDTLLVGTIEEVRKHPLLKEIVEWRIVPTGKVEVDSVDEALAFGHVTEQEDGREISRYQKITRVIPKPEEHKDATGPATPPKDPMEEPPRLGFAVASLWTGGYSREYSSQAQTFSGGGFLYGARAAGEIWLNRDFFVDLAMGYGAFGYSQTDSTGTATPAGSVGGNVFTLTADLGYTYLITGDFFGPRAWLKAGYHSGSYTLPVNANEATSPYSVKSIFLGLGGDLPIRDNYGANVELDFGAFNFASETGGIDGNVSSSHDAVIYIGGYYRYKPRILFRLGFEIQGNGSNFDLPSSISQKTLAILPAVQYSF
jgi:hypothetical protein